MIQFRKNPFSEESQEIGFIENETAFDLVQRTLLQNGYDGQATTNLFQILINGLKLEKEFWDITVINKNDTVLIAPQLKRGDGAQLFKTLAIIAITVVASVYLGPAVGGGIYGALAVAGATVAATLALNALIPPPSLPGIGSLGSLEQSQMYSISAQSNAEKRFQSVPKVYGTHRMFPVVAATPYVEIGADPEDPKKLVQYLTAVYDFGLGPALIQDIRIGNTRIGEFEDIDWNLVDPNSNEASTLSWDAQTDKTFTIYKGDYDQQSLSIALNKNQNVPNTPVEDYQAERTGALNPDLKSQEIVLDFVFPQGLGAYGTDGVLRDRTVELQIEFSKDNENTWRKYNDLTYVSKAKNVGGSNVYKDLKYYLEYPNQYTQYGIIYNETESLDYGPSFAGYNSTFNNFDYADIRKVGYGYKKGTSTIVLRYSISSSSLPAVNDNIIFKGKVIGRVQAVSTAITLSGNYATCTLAEPLKADLLIWEASRYDLRDRLETESYPTLASFVFPDNLNKSGVYSWDSYANLIYTESIPDLRLAKLSGTRVSTGRVAAKDKTTAPRYFSVRFTPREAATYKVRVTRLNSSSTVSYQVLDSMIWSAYTTRTNSAAIITKKRHIYLELRIRATNQLNGSIQNLSARVASALDVYNPNTQTWSKQITSNPAWVFCDLLTGEINPRPIPKSRLDMNSIVAWANYCAQKPANPPGMIFRQPRFKCNFVFDFPATLQDILNKVTNSAQASLNIIDSKYGVLVDRNVTTPVQIFTPRNSWGFSSSRNYVNQPHALKVKFVSEAKSWQVDEAIIYNDGYTSANATEFQDLQSFGVTNYEQAWRFGRYMLSQALLRQETIGIQVDFEHIVCTRGDFVQITQDVMKVGGRPARVRSVLGNVVKIDDGIDTTPDPYGYTFRSANGIYTSTLTVIDSDEFELDGALPSVGDLIIIGPVGFITYDCIVKSITPNDDMSASITLVERAPEIYSAESSVTLPKYKPTINPSQDSDLAAPPAVIDLAVISNTWRVIGQNYQYYIGIDWDVEQSGVAIELYEVYADSGQGFNLVYTTKETAYEFIVNEANLGVEHFFKVLAVSATGKKIPLIESPTVSATPARKVNPPSNVEALYINITNQVMQLEWTRVSDPDLKEYLLRYTPDTVGGQWEVSIPFAKIDGTTNTSSIQARTGTYLIKSVDLNGNESLTAAFAVTSIPNLFDLNVVEETNDFPTLPGTLDTVNYDAGGLTINKLNPGDPTNNEYYPIGYYYYGNFLNLGEIYTVRLQSSIRAEGFTEADIMANWLTLEDLLYMSNAGTAAWDVETEVRGTDQFLVMSEWTALSEVDPMSEGVQDVWTPWRKFIIGDFTARIFQFRLKLVSNVPSVTPRVFDGVIKADMPDRTWTQNNILSNVMGSTILYSPGFYGPGTSPNIQITQDDSEQGDYFVISNKNLNGFDIVFYDKDNNPVVRQFDVAAKGYGYKALAVI